MAESTITDEKILEVEQLRTWFPVKRGVLNKHVGDIKAVDGLNFFVRKGSFLKDLNLCNIPKQIYMHSLNFLQFLI